MATKPKNCTECGQPCTENSLKRRDAADQGHDFRVDCYIAMAWWMAGHGGKPSEDAADWVKYHRKMRKNLRAEAAAYGKKVGV